MSSIHGFVGPNRFKGFFAIVTLSLALTVGVAWTPTAKPRAWFWVRQKARRSTNSNTELLTLRLLKRASAQPGPR